MKLYNKYPIKVLTFHKIFNFCNYKANICNMKQVKIYKFDNSANMMDKFKRYIKTHECPEVTLDLSALNVLDAVKYALLSSAYHYGKYPSGKLKYHVPSEEIKNIISNFSMNNLEPV